MHKFMMIFYQPLNPERFEDSYNSLLALVERMPYILRRQVITVTGSPMGQSNILRILEVYYESSAKMQESLMSPPGQEAGGQIATFPQGSFEMVFADVYEEDGGYTPAKPTPPTANTNGKEDTTLTESNNPPDNPDGQSSTGNTGDENDHAGA